MSTTYKAKSLSGAERRVRELTRQVKHLDEVLGRWMAKVKQLETERRELAKLAAKGPCFFNPLAAMAAETLRDRILRDECKLAPDGKYLG